MSYGNSYGGNNPYGGSNPYQQGPSAEGGYGYDQQEHELQDYPNQQSDQPTSNTLQQQEFLNRCQFLHNEIGTLRTNVSDISSLHQRSLAEADNGISAQNLERIVADTQALNAGIRDQLKFLANDAAKTPGGLQSLKKKQVDHIKAEFERELRNYQAEEGTFRQRYRDQIARQYRIVNPEASEDEVRQASEMDWGNEGVFQTALRSNRVGQASNILGNVRARHNELQRIEKTLYELASMFQDLAVLVEQQEEAVVQVEHHAEDTTKYVDEGNKHTDAAIQSARNARKWKWWCLGIVILILIIIAIVLAVVFTKK